jgi:oligoribonuclease NrnB/cAMP/cGMP phosphodiesterase (DHH superfamily)
MIKHFTHTDLDGYSCRILGELAFVEDNINTVHCNYDEIDKKVQTFIKNIDLNKWTQIFITDISINEKTALLLDNLSTKITIKLFDHHTTAGWLNKYNWANVHIKFDDELTCGTSLFYWYLETNNFFKENLSIHQQKNLFEFTELVRKYDTWLWKNKYNDTAPKQWNDLLHIVGKDDFITNIKDKIKNYGNIGFSETEELLLKYEQIKIDKYIEQKQQTIISKNILGYNVGVVFSELYGSELGNILCENHPEFDFVAIINMDKAISYRIVGDKVNLGEQIATMYGGGGQSKAAGSPITRELRESIIEKIFELKTI